MRRVTARENGRGGRSCANHSEDFEACTGCGAVKDLSKHTAGMCTFWNCTRQLRSHGQQARWLRLEWGQDFLTEYEVWAKEWSAGFVLFNVVEREHGLGLKESPSQKEVWYSCANIHSLAQLHIPITSPTVSTYPQAHSQPPIHLPINLLSHLPAFLFPYPSVYLHIYKFLSQSVYHLSIYPLPACLTQYTA